MKSSVLELIGIIATLALFVFLLIPQVVIFFRRLYSNINPITLNIQRRLHFSLLNGLLITVPSLLFVLHDIDQSGTRFIRSFFGKYVPVLIYVCIPIILAWIRPIPAHPLDLWDILIAAWIFFVPLANALITKFQLLFGAHIESTRLWADFNSTYVLAGNLCLLMYTVLRPLPDTGFGRELRLPTLWDIALMLVGIACISLMAPILLTTDMVKDSDTVTTSPGYLLLNFLLMFVFMALPLELFYRGAIQNLLHARVEVYFDIKNYCSDTALEGFSLNGDSANDSQFRNSIRSTKRSPKNYKTLSSSAHLNEPLTGEEYPSRTLFDTSLSIPDVRIYGDTTSTADSPTSPSGGTIREHYQLQLQQQRHHHHHQKQDDDYTYDEKMDHHSVASSDHSINIVPLGYKPPSSITHITTESPMVCPTEDGGAIHMSNLAKSGSFISSAKISTTVGSSRDVQDSTFEMLGEGQVSFQTSRKIRVLQSELESPSWPTWTERNAKAFEGSCTRWWQFPSKYDYICWVIGSVIYAMSLTYHITSVVQRNNEPNPQDLLWIPVFFILLWQGLVSGYVWRMTSQVWCSALVTAFFLFFASYWIDLRMD